MKRALPFAVIAILVVFVAASALARPRVTQLWALYVADRAAGSRPVLFLEPFPDFYACAVAARAVVAGGGDRAVCRSHTVVAFATAPRPAALERDFAAGGVWDQLVIRCGLRGRER